MSSVDNVNSNSKNYCNLECLRMIQANTIIMWIISLVVLILIFRIAWMIRKNKKSKIAPQKVNSPNTDKE